MFRFLVLVIAVLVVFTACENDPEVVQPNPDLTMSYADFMDNAPGAPSLTPGIHEQQLLHCTNIHGRQFYEWVGILAGDGFLAGDEDVGTPSLMFIVHATLVRIPDGQEGDVQYVYVYDHQGFQTFSFPFSVNKPSVILKRTYVALKNLARNLGPSTDYTGSVKTVDLFSCGGNITRLDPDWVVYETNTAVETAPIADVTALKFPKHLITIDGTETKMRDGYPARFYANEEDANAYRDYRRTHREFFPIGDWYNIALFLKGHGARDGIMLIEAQTEFDPIQNFVEEAFPETEAAQRAFVRERVGEFYQEVIDNGELYIKFSPPFDKKQEAIAFSHQDAIDETTYTSDKLDFRFGLELDVHTAQAQRNMYQGGDFGTSALIGTQIAIYTDESGTDPVVKGIANVGGGQGLLGVVNFGGVQLTRKVLWNYKEGTTVPAGLVTDLRTFFGFTNTWGRTSNPSALPRPTPLPVLLVLNTTAGTFSTTDPVNLYSIPNAHKIKWYFSAALAKTGINGQDAIEAGARLYTYFDISQ